MIVSLGVAKYLQSAGYNKECEYEYWGDKLHRSTEPYQPEETIPAPDILEALDWISRNKNLVISIHTEGDKKYGKINVPQVASVETSKLPSFNEAIFATLELIAELGRRDLMFSEYDELIQRGLK